MESDEVLKKMQLKFKLKQHEWTNEFDLCAAVGRRIDLNESCWFVIYVLMCYN